MLMSVYGITISKFESCLRNHWDLKKLQQMCKAIKPEWIYAMQFFLYDLITAKRALCMVQPTHLTSKLNKYGQLTDRKSVCACCKIHLYLVLKLKFMNVSDKVKFLLNVWVVINMVNCMWTVNCIDGSKMCYLLWRQAGLIFVIQFQFLKLHSTKRHVH